MAGASTGCATAIDLQAFVALDPRFLAQLRERPRNWPAWLVFADWLDDRADERGELIRLRHRLSTETLSATDGWELRELVLEREAELTVALQSTIGRIEGAELLWNDAFVTAARVFVLDASTLEYVETLDGHPAVLFEERALRPRGLVSVPNLVQHASRYRFTHLALSRQRLGTTEMELLAACEGLSHTWWLDLSGNPIGDHGIEYLIHAGWFGGLSWLDLTRCDVRIEGATRLVLAAQQEELDTVVLRDNHFSASQLPSPRPSGPTLIF